MLVVKDDKELCRQLSVLTAVRWQGNYQALNITGFCISKSASKTRKPGFSRYVLLSET